MMKRWMCGLLVFMLLAGLGAFAAADNDISWALDNYKQRQEEQRVKAQAEAEAAAKAGSEDTVFISSVGDLMVFRSRVEGGEPGLNAVLMADIDLSEVCGAETGDWPGIQGYNGVFDGNYHTLTGLYAMDETAENAGLFWSGMGTIKNLTLENVQLRGGRYVGGVASYFEGTIENCVVRGSITGVNLTGMYFGAGGIAGRAKGAISGCLNEAAVTCLCDDLQDPYGYAGGILGDSYYATIANCLNTGAITSQGYSAGGILGASIGDGSSKDFHYMNDCVNYGEVVGQYTAGGVIGFARNMNMTRCGNGGRVEAAEVSGGVIGTTSSTKKMKCTVLNCYNRGEVTVSTWNGDYYVKNGSSIDMHDTQYAAGLIGMLYNTTVINCYNAGRISCETGEENHNSYGLIGYKSGYDTTGNCYNCGELASTSETYEVGGVSTIALDNVYCIEAAEPYVSGYDQGDWAAQYVLPASALTDGTLLTELQNYENANDYELSGWVQGENGPALDWE